MSAQVPGSSRRSAVPIAALLALPAVLFYAVLFRFAVNIPTLDDYDAALDFVDRMSQTSGLPAKAVLFFSTQHNEYKTLFGNAIFWLQYSVFGQVNFRLSSAVGNLFTVLIGVVLWKMFLPRVTERTTRLALFVPVCWLLFQLNFAESLDAPMTALAWLPTLTFCFAAIYLLTRGDGKGFYQALVLLVLGIFSSTNGFILVPIGALILVLARRYARLAGWLGVTAGCMALYLFHYTRAASPVAGPPAGGLLQHSLLLKPVFVLCVLGDAVGYPLRLTGSAVLGLALCVGFVLLARRGFFRRNPAIGYCVLFLALTAMGIATIRSSSGIEGSLSSRYRMYSDLLLIFAWMSSAREAKAARA